MLSQTMHHTLVGGNSRDAKMKVKAYCILHATVSGRRVTLSRLDPGDERTARILP